MLKSWFVALGVVLGGTLSSCYEMLPPAEASGSGDLDSLDAVAHLCQPADPDGVISRHALARLPYIAPGNSSHAIHAMTGYPRCYVGLTEYFPLHGDESTWIAIKFDQEGRYVGYGFSAAN